jgi:Fe-S cluster biogenesis protein NfuA
MFLSKLFKKSKDYSDTAVTVDVLLAKDKPMEEIQVFVQSTPNPNAYKFITTKDVKTGGTASYSDPESCNVDLAKALLNVPAIEQVYFFDNVITVTINPSVPINELKDRIIAVIKEKLPAHDPNYKTEEDVQQQNYEALPEDLKRINEILDRTVRPGLQGDGGNIEILSLVDNQLSVRYQGACGSCPSSMMGTLQAITQILRDEFDPDIDVVPV